MPISNNCCPIHHNILFWSESVYAKSVEVGKEARFLKAGQSIGICLILKNTWKSDTNRFLGELVPPKRAEIPYLKRAHAAFNPSFFEIVGVNLDEDTNTIKKFVNKTKLTWTHVRNISNQIGSLYNVISIPSPFLIDPSGKIVAEGIALRGPNLIPTIQRQLKAAFPGQEIVRANAPKTVARIPPTRIPQRSLKSRESLHRKPPPQNIDAFLMSL